ncbi:hypothetical protein [Methylobacterium tardum]|uniref:Uncharacterized protein n=1 Tax=Methylobacterium tardum TaxID=374432 RepID=A0AA37WSV1_9HYPH|nr:hypothetical protein [Methylobacterium tardum]GLS70797.1 hypothetical protein GCM10007890_28100 [Methylobacterium tardum]
MGDPVAGLRADRLVRCDGDRLDLRVERARRGRDGALARGDLRLDLRLQIGDMRREWIDGVAERHDAAERRRRVARDRSRKCYSGLLI